MIAREWFQRCLLAVGISLAMSGCSDNFDPSSGGTTVYVKNDTSSAVELVQCALPSKHYPKSDDCAGDESAVSIEPDSTETVDVLASVVLRIDDGDEPASCLLATPGETPYAEVEISSAHPCQKVEQWVMSDEFHDDLRPASRKS